MRPAGEVRQALLDAALALTTPERSPTLAEMAAKAQVGRDAAMHTTKNMVRSRVLEIPRTRSVPYRNRPVAEYRPVAKNSAPAPASLPPAAASIWAGAAA